MSAAVRKESPLPAGKSVLIIDDEPDIRDLVGMMLKVRSIPSLTASTADEGLAILGERSDDIGLILLDLSIPNSADTPVLDLKP